MFTAIHRELGREPGDLTHELLDAAVTASVRETDDLDWKAELPTASREPKWQVEFAKDVAAMANSGGGWLVYGVREDRKTSAAIEVVGVGTFEQSVEQQLRGVAYGNIRPPVQNLQFLPLQDPDRGDVLVLRVPASVDVPHLLPEGPHKFGAPRRYGAQTQWMSERDLERAYRTRFDGQRDRQRALDDLMAAQERAVRLRLGNVWRGRVVVVGVAVPAEERLPVSLSVEQAADILHAAAALANQIADEPPNYHFRDLPPSPGLRRMTRAEDDAWTSVHLDGSVSLARKLPVPRVEDYGGLLVPTLHMEAAVAGLVATAAATGRALGVTGAYLLKIALLWADLEQVRYARPDRHFVDEVRLVEPPQMVYEVEPTGTEMPADGDLATLRGTARTLALDLLHQGGVYKPSYIA